MKSIRCDICKEHEGKTLQIELGRRQGPIGDFEIHYGYIDICPKCFLRMVLAYFKDEPPDTAREVIRILTCPDKKAA
jgi:hypothetical protein